jgi:hypothetical protein
MGLGIVAALVLTGACGDDDDNHNQNDNYHLPADAAVGPDADMSHCDELGFHPADELAAPFEGGGGYRYNAYSSSQPPTDVMSIQMYEGYDPPESPGTYSLNGSNYATCGLCLLLFKNCGTQECEKTYYADVGDVELTALGSGLGSTFSGILHDVEFKEVTIDDQTFESTPVPGGETWCVSSFSFNQTLVDPNEALCSQGDINCVGETIPDFSLTHCQTGNSVSMSSLVAGNHALWFVGTHEWCAACASFLPDALSYYDSRASNGLAMAIVLGENQSGGQPSQQQCQAYAADYPGHEDLVYLDHDGQYSHAALFTHLYFYPDSQQRVSFPWNGVLDAQTMEYVYADGDGSGSDVQTAIESLLP